MMLHRLASVFFVLLVFLAGPQAMGATIGISVHFEQGAINEIGSQSSREAFAQTMVDDMEVALAQSSLGQHSYRIVYVDPTPFPLVGFASPAIELSLDSQVRQDRNSFGADVAVLLHDLTGQPCGEASTPTSISASNADAFAFIAFDWVCILAFEETSPHETGHILAADHEPPDALPQGAKPYNHAHINSTAQLQSVMASAPNICGPQCDTRLQYSDPSKNFAGTSVVSGNSQVADVVRLIDDDNSFLTVAAYRQPVSPPKANLRMDILCLGNGRDIAAVISPPSGNHVLDTTELWEKPGSVLPWRLQRSWTPTDGTEAYWHDKGSTTLWKARYRNETGYGAWSVILTGSDQCAPGNPPPQ